MMSEILTLPLDAISINGGTQSRVSLNEATVAEYAEFIRLGGDLPPVIVFEDGSSIWLADGFHRFHAHRAAGAMEIACDVRPGTKRDAILFSVGANASHGLRRTNEDKRRAVMTLLNDAEWSKWSDNAIAKACAVSDKTVTAHRASIFGNSEDAPSVRKVERNGTTYEQNTANIGKSSKKAEAQAATAASIAPKEMASAVEAPLAEALPAGEISANPDDYGPSAEEMADALAAEQAEIEMLRRIAASDDRIAAAIAEAKRQRELVAGLDRRIAGLMNEKQAAIQQAESWKKKYERLDKQFKALEKSIKVAA